MTSIQRALDHINFALTIADHHGINREMNHRLVNIMCEAINKQTWLADSWDWQWEVTR